MSRTNAPTRLEPTKARGRVAAAVLGATVVCVALGAFATMAAAATNAPPRPTRPPRVAVTAPACPPFTLERQKAHADIAKRLTSLDQLTGLLNGAQDPYGVNGTQTGALADAKSGLGALDQKIQTNCYPDRATLDTEARTIFTGYRVYWLRTPQTRILESADHLGVARQTLGASATKLAGLVGSNQKAQADLAAMNQALATADGHVGNPPALGGGVAAVPGLAPAVDMTANVTALKAARADLEAARRALDEARRDGLRVVADLGGTATAP